MPESGWGDWLVDDQRHAASRTDVLVYQTEPLKEPLRIAGQPIAQLFASTSGSDADWVVKIIDVWPDEVPEQPEARRLPADAVGGHLPRPLSRRSRQAAAAHGRTRCCRTEFALPHASHTFLPGHRIMVQIQSSWFPLYDRNPQTFVPNIMYAKPESYVKATQRIWHTPGIPERDRTAGDPMKHFQWNRGTCGGNSASARCRTARADSGGEQPVERCDELPHFGGRRVVHE